MIKQPLQKFMIVSAARTGSNYLRSMLGAHSGIKMYGEPFNLDGLSKTDLTTVLENPLNHLDSLLLDDVPENMVGFKLFYDHLTREYFTKLIDKKDTCGKVKNRFDELDNYLYEHFDLQKIYSILEKARNSIVTDKQFKIIHLVRSNKLRSFLSLKKAYLTDRWFSFKKSKNADKGIQINFKECQAYFRKLENYESQHRNLFKDHKYIEVTYEELVEQKDSELNRIFGFLEMPNEEVKSVLQRQNNASLNESIANYNEIKNQFTSTPWLRYFDE